CCSGGVKKPKAAAMRPGVDVCSMCMDNKPLLEMRRCHHRIVSACEKGGGSEGAL
ncbi:hypothetical protein HaLaN_27133, partial [Haematococcus lacustris]